MIMITNYKIVFFLNWGVKIALNKNNNNKMDVVAYTVKFIFLVIELIVFNNIFFHKFIIDLNILKKKTSEKQLSTLGLRKKDHRFRCEGL